MNASELLRFRLTCDVCDALPAFAAVSANGLVAAWACSAHVEALHEALQRETGCALGLRRVEFPSAPIAETETDPIAEFGEWMELRAERLRRHGYGTTAATLRFALIDYREGAEP